MIFGCIEVIRDSNLILIDQGAIKENRLKTKVSPFISKMSHKNQLEIAKKIKFVQSSNKILTIYFSLSFPVFFSPDGEDFIVSSKAEVLLHTSGLSNLITTSVSVSGMSARRELSPVAMTP